MTVGIYYGRQYHRLGPWPISRRGFFDRGGRFGGGGALGVRIAVTVRLVIRQIRAVDISIPSRQNIMAKS